MNKIMKILFKSVPFLFALNIIIFSAVIVICTHVFPELLFSLLVLFFINNVIIFFSFEKKSGDIRYLKDELDDQRKIMKIEKEYHEKKERRYKEYIKSDKSRYEDDLKYYKSCLNQEEEASEKIIKTSLKMEAEYRGRLNLLRLELNSAKEENDKLRKKIRDETYH